MAEDDADFRSLLHKENGTDLTKEPPLPAPSGGPAASAGGEEPGFCVAEDGSLGGVGGGRWDKSLGVLCQKFIMLFLVTPVSARHPMAVMIFTPATPSMWVTVSHHTHHTSDHSFTHSISAFVLLYMCIPILMVQSRDSHLTFIIPFQDNEVTLDFAGNILMPDDGSFFPQPANPKSKPFPPLP